MFKKIFLLVVISVLVSCKGTKYATKKPISTKPKTEKPIVKKPTTVTPKPATPKPTTQNQTTETLEATSTTTVYADVVKNYIEQYKETAKENMRTHGILASITLAQGILESGAGNGRLAKEGNNHFGIKCHKEWRGDVIHHDDDAAQECFRKYRHASESFTDHSLFLTSRSRYNDLFKLAKDDYKGWAHGLRKAGYATDPKYPDKLISLIERYQLYQYDDEVLGNTPRSIDTNTVEQVTTSDDVHRVAQGDTLYSISRRYNISVDELKRLNNLNDNAISIGQLLKVK